MNFVDACTPNPATACGRKLFLRRVEKGNMCMMITGVKRLLYHGCCLGIVSGACSPTREQQGCSSEVGEAESTLVCSFTGKYVYCLTPQSFLMAWAGARATCANEDGSLTFP